MATKRKEARKGMSIKAISISDELWQELLNRARLEEKSASVIIRDLIKGYLAKVKKKEGK
jgi:predicted CopG family antitoxin